MMTLLLWVVLFLLCIALIAGIFVRHFDQLAAFNIGSVPEIQEKSTKQQIVSKRILRTMRERSTRVAERLAPIARLWMRVQLAFRNFANQTADQYRHLEWKKQWQKWMTRSRHELRAHLLKLLEESDELRRGGEYADAEKRYVDIISLDPKNVNAYLGLAKAYYLDERWKDGEETARHIIETLDPASELGWAFLGRHLKQQGKYVEAAAAFKQALAINPNMAKRWIDLGECLREGGGLAEAIVAYRTAAEHEPNNPRVLDLLLEISILSGDKRLAREAFIKLQAANPENQKLGDWEAKIREM